MKGTLKEIDTLHYAHVKRLVIKVRGGSVAVEIPEKILEDAGWTPSIGDTLEIEISREKPGDLDKWDIVMGGDVYFKREEGKKVYASLGGLKLAIEGEKFYDAFNVDDKIYLSLRVSGKT